jgi:TonB family protein
MLRVAAIGVAFFAIGYVFSQPLTQASSAVARAGRGTWQGMGTKQQPVEILQAATAPAQYVTPDTPKGHAGKISVVPVRNSQHARITADMPQPITQSAALQEPVPEQPQTLPASLRSIHIPESLGAPFPGVTAAREVAAKLSPALMDALEPVSIPGSLSEKLLLQKIDPSYPEKALRAGLRGPVVLQAWIGKDGRIQELKLIRGPLLLGQAAFDAVRNWRYKPYLLNGEAVEAQTLVTVDFKLP